MRAQRRAEAKWMRTESSQSLREWEEEVKQKFEWNGLGQAQVLLRSSSSCTTGNDKGVEKNCDTKKRKRRHDDSFEEEKKEENCSSNRIDAEHGQEDVLADKKILKKKRKSEKKSSKKKSKERSE
jgi:hypothetical protein